MGRYGEDMIQSAVTHSDESVEAALRDDLAQGNAVLQSAAPVMRHLLSGARHPIFADEIVARVRGGLGDIARQLLDSITGEPTVHGTATLDALTGALIDLPGLLGHLHALALEWQLAERLQQRLALDPVLPPLLQALLASDDATTAALAMNLLAAQARFTQTQRRMQLPLNELPADLLHGALLALRTFAGEPQAGAAEAAIRAGYDESRTRLALIARLVTGMGSGAVAALALSHAGVSTFATALAMASGQDRDVVILSASEGQQMRLGLTLRAAGLKHGAIGELLLTLHPAGSPAVDWDRIAADRAATLLAVIPHGGT
jgi:hypothetical protein